MDPQPEVTISEAMERTRNRLRCEIETLENKVLATANNLTATVSDSANLVKEAVHDTVDTVKGSVEATVESAKEALDLSRQIARHPWAVVGASVGVGFVISQLLPPSSESRRVPTAYYPWLERGSNPPVPGGNWPAQEKNGRGANGSAHPSSSPGVLHQLVSMFEPELNKLKGVAVSTMLGVIRDMVTHSAPRNLKSQLADVIDDVTKKLGGEPIPGPLLEPSRPYSPPRSEPDPWCQ